MGTTSATCTFDQMLQSRLAEARLDAVALDEIIDQGRNWYGFEGDELERFIRRMIGGLLNAGMVVVVPAPRGSNVDWVLNSAYQCPIGETIDELMKDWKGSPDGYAFFAWFTDPRKLASSGSER